VRAPDHPDLAARLQADPRMETVWRVLSQRKLRPRPAVFTAEPTGEVIWRSIAPSAYSLRDAVSWLIVSLATHRVDVTKRAELEAACGRYRRLAAELDRSAEELHAAALTGQQVRGPGPSGLRKRAHLLAAAAVACREIAEMWPVVNPESLTIDRDHGDREVRAFCVLLAQQFERLFGERLPRQVATIASVVFGTETPDHRVRDWL
jgi:hypothetical protein